MAKIKKIRTPGRFCPKCLQPMRVGQDSVSFYHDGSYKYFHAECRFPTSDRRAFARDAEPFDPELWRANNGYQHPAYLSTGQRRHAGVVCRKCGSYYDEDEHGNRICCTDPVTLELGDLL